MAKLVFIGAIIVIVWIFWQSFEHHNFMAEIRFPEILQDAPLATLIVNNLGSIQSMNDAAKVLFGYEENELSDRRIDDIILPPSNDQPQVSEPGIVRTQLILHSSTEVNALKKNGSTFHAKVTERPHLLHDNNIILIFVEDLTTEKFLSEKFAKIFYKSPAAKVLSKANTGKIVDVNETFSRLTGYAKDELIGKTSVEVGFFSDSAVRDILIQEIRSQGRAGEH